MIEYNNTNIMCIRKPGSDYDIFTTVRNNKQEFIFKQDTSSTLVNVISNGYQLKDIDTRTNRPGATQTIRYTCSPIFHTNPIDFEDDDNVKWMTGQSVTSMYNGRPCEIPIMWYNNGNANLIAFPYYSYSSSAYFTRSNAIAVFNNCNIQTEWSVGMPLTNTNTLGNYFYDCNIHAMSIAGITNRNETKAIIERCSIVTWGLGTRNLFNVNAANNCNISRLIYENVNRVFIRNSKINFVYNQNAVLSTINFINCNINWLNNLNYINAVNCNINHVTLNKYIYLENTIVNYTNIFSGTTDITELHLRNSFINNVDIPNASVYFNSIKLNARYNATSYLEDFINRNESREDYITTKSLEIKNWKIIAQEQLNSLYSINAYGTSARLDINYCNLNGVVITGELLDCDALNTLDIHSYYGQWNNVNINYNSYNYYNMLYANLYRTGAFSDLKVQISNVNLTYNKWSTRPFLECNLYDVHGDNFFANLHYNNNSAGVYFRLRDSTLNNAAIYVSIYNNANRFVPKINGSYMRSSDINYRTFNNTAIYTGEKYINNITCNVSTSTSLSHLLTIAYVENNSTPSNVSNNIISNIAIQMDYDYDPSVKINQNIIIALESMTNSSVNLMRSSAVENYMNMFIDGLGKMYDRYGTLITTNAAYCTVTVPFNAAWNDYNFIPFDFREYTLSEYVEDLTPTEIKRVIDNLNIQYYVFQCRLNSRSHSVGVGNSKLTISIA